MVQWLKEDINMSQRKRFSFDDEVDDTIDLSKDDLKNSSITNNDKPSNDNVFADEDGLDAKAYPTDNGGDKSMKQTQALIVSILK